MTMSIIKAHTTQGVIVSSKNKFDEVIYKKNLARPDASASTVKYKDLAPEAQAVHKAIEEFREKGEWVWAMCVYALVVVGGCRGL